MSRARWSISQGYGGGMCVRVQVGGQSIGRFFGPLGGEWELSDDGTRGRQLVGTCDVRAPMEERAFSRWVRRQYAEAVADMRRGIE